MINLNDKKTELMLVTSKGTKHLHNLPNSITIDNAQNPFKQSVKNLGLAHTNNHYYYYCIYNGDYIHVIMFCALFSVKNDTIAPEVDQRLLNGSHGIDCSSTLKTSLDENTLRLCCTFLKQQVSLFIEHC